MADRIQPEPDPAPLAERFPGYARAFGVGLAAMVGLGLLIGLLSSNSVIGAMGATLFIGGGFVLLAGGATGGGYTNWGGGALTALVGGRNRMDEDVDDDAVRLGDPELRGSRTDPMERLRRKLRPAANPGAFWTVIAGVLYVAGGIGLLALSS